jgi:hypothetical protein
MAIPLIVYGAAAAGAAAGSIIGALSRQPEINRLKKQVSLLQAEISRIQGLIVEQSRQISELKIRYNVIKGYNFLLRSKFEGSIKGHIINQYAFREYVAISKTKLNGVELDEKSKSFFGLYDKLITGGNLEFKEFSFLKNYLIDKYEIQIKQLIPLDADKITRLIGA